MNSGTDTYTYLKKWGSRVSVTGFNPAYTVTDAYNLICDALDKGLACSYISNDEYLHLPAWIQDVASLLRNSWVRDLEFHGIVTISPRGAGSLLSGHRGIKTGR